MCFPEKDFFYLKQLANRWDVGIEDVQHAITCNKLMAYIFTRPIFATRMREHSSNEFTISSSASKVEGFVVIFPEDCHELFFEGAIELRRFISVNDNCSYLLPDNLPPIKLFEDRLVVLKSECERFERAFDLDIISQKDPFSVHKIKDRVKGSGFFESDNNFKCVKLKGKRLYFGNIQASVVAQLFEASKTENPWVYGKTLLNHAGSQSFVMRDVFRRNDGWQDLIHSDGKGYYRLNAEITENSKLASTKKEKAL